MNKELKLTTCTTTVVENIATIKIHREEKLNALSTLVINELSEVLNFLEGLKVSSALLTSTGGKAFVAGADIKEMSQMSISESREFAKLGQKLTLDMEQSSFPIIACVDGFALGGGCELAMACDFIYATKKSTFGQPEVNLGLIPCFGGCARLHKYVGPARAKELIYTGKPITAELAKSYGLVNEVFETRDDMLEAAKEIAELMKKKSGVAIAECKRTMEKSLFQSNEEGLKREADGFEKAFSSEERTEGISAFLEKRAPNWQ